MNQSINIFILITKLKYLIILILNLYFPIFNYKLVSRNRCKTLLTLFL
jgi:hypothetical protein